MKVIIWTNPHAGSMCRSRWLSGEGLPNGNHHSCEEGRDPLLLYKHFVNMHKVIILPKQYYVQPYLVGKDKRSLALILPAKLVKALDINAITILFLLKVGGHDELHLQIIRQEQLEKKDAENTPAIKVAKQEVDGCQ